MVFKVSSALQKNIEVLIQKPEEAENPKGIEIKAWN